MFERVQPAALRLHWGLATVCKYAMMALHSVTPESPFPCHTHAEVPGLRTMRSSRQPVAPRLNVVPRGRRPRGRAEWTHGERQGSGRGALCFYQEGSSRETLRSPRGDQGDGKRAHSPWVTVTPREVQTGSRTRKRVVEDSAFYVQSTEIHVLFKQIYSSHMVLTFYGRGAKRAVSWKEMDNNEIMVEMTRTRLSQIMDVSIPIDEKRSDSLQQ